MFFRGYGWVQYLCLILLLAFFGSFVEGLRGRRVKKGWTWGNQDGQGLDVRTWKFIIGCEHLWTSCCVETHVASQEMPFFWTCAWQGNRFLCGRWCWFRSFSAAQVVTNRMVMSKNLNVKSKFDKERLSMLSWYVFFLDCVFWKEAMVPRDLFASIWVVHVLMCAHQELVLVIWYIYI